MALQSATDTSWTLLVLWPYFANKSLFWILNRLDKRPHTTFIEPGEKLLYRHMGVRNQILNLKKMQLVPDCTTCPWWCTKCAPITLNSSTICAIGNGIHSNTWVSWNFHPLYPCRLTQEATQFLSDTLSSLSFKLVDLMNTKIEHIRKYFHCFTGTSKELQIPQTLLP